MSKKCCAFSGCSTTPSFNLEGITKALFCSKHREPTMVDVKNKGKRCKFETCKKQATCNEEGNKKPLFCAEHCLAGMTNVVNLRCKEADCKKHPVYAVEGSIRGIYCYDHKKENMVNIKKKICAFEKCNTIATYTNIGLTSARFCKKHKEENMIILYKKKCEYIGCQYRPSYNVKSENIARFCSEHKEPNMINVTKLLCEHKDCNKISCFNYLGEVNGKFCVEHKESGMVDVINIKKICEYTDCNKHPSYNFVGQNIGRLCNDHKEDHMIDILHNMCSEKGCVKRSSYGFPGYYTIVCFTHRVSGMIRHSTKKICGNDICNNYAIYGISEPLHCETHALIDEYNLVERECSTCKRVDLLNKNGICVNFCSLEEADRVVKKLVKHKEEAINKLLDEHIKVPVFSLDESPDRFCTSKRPDRVYHLGSHVVIIEIDENQHKSYKCTAYGDTTEGRMKGERIRMYEIAQSYPEFPPCIFIRYNPDTFKNKNGVLSKISNTKRHELLIKWVQRCIDFNDVKGLLVKYLFYDGFYETDASFETLHKEDVL